MDRAATGRISARSRVRGHGRGGGGRSTARDSRDTYDDALEAQSINRLKKRIRDVARLLQRATDMPADQRVAKEREQQSLKHDLALAQVKKKKAKLIKRYHMIRFFERQKAERHLKKSKRALEQSSEGDDQGSLQRQVEIALFDLNYTLYSPLFQPYSSLYPPKRDDPADKTAHAPTGALTARHDNPTWLRVQRATLEGERALKQLRDEIPKGGQTKEPPSKGTKHDLSGGRSNKRDRDAGSNEGREVDSEDDGDNNFFE